MNLYILYFYKFYNSHIKKKYLLFYIIFLKYKIKILFKNLNLILYLFENYL